MYKPLNILIAGGGTGGHLFPGIAIAQDFMNKNPMSRILFIGSGKPFEYSNVSKAGFPYKAITVEGIKRRGLRNQIAAFVKIPIGIFQSFHIIRYFNPDLIVGVGGYSSGPVAIAAKILGIPVVLHEQNMLAGMTNRILSFIADRIYVSFEHTHGGLPPGKTRITGNPVRKEIIEKAECGTETSEFFTVLIIGGSQGAHRINMAVIDALEFLAEKENYFFIHQTGTDDEAAIKAAYQRHGISCTVKSFFSDMPIQYQKSNLLICRSGATTVAEITAIGKAAIFIPFPFAADNHQVLNARALVNNGAAEMILQENLNGKVLAGKISDYAANPEILSAMASKAKRFGKPAAAHMIVEDCYAVMLSKMRGMNKWI